MVYKTNGIGYSVNYSYSYKYRSLPQSNNETLEQIDIFPYDTVHHDRFEQFKIQRGWRRY